MNKLEKIYKINNLSLQFGKLEKGKEFKLRQAL
jgi:hypothetical protein